MANIVIYNNTVSEATRSCLRGFKIKIFLGEACPDPLSLCYACTAIIIVLSLLAPHNNNIIWALHIRPPEQNSEINPGTYGH